MRNLPPPLPAKATVGSPTNTGWFVLFVDAIDIGFHPVGDYVGFHPVGDYIGFHPVGDYVGFHPVGDYRGRRRNGRRVKIFTEKDVRVRDHPDTWVGHRQVGESLVQHADLPHGGGEEVRRVQSGQEPRPECPIEEHIENVVPIEDSTCLLVRAESAPRQEGALGVALPQGVAGHCSCSVVHRGPTQTRRVVLYVLSPWNEDELASLVI